jgi:hypothetical protein
MRFSSRALLFRGGLFSDGRFSFRASRDAVNGEGALRRSSNGRALVNRSTMRPVVHPPSTMRSKRVPERERWKFVAQVCRSMWAQSPRIPARIAKLYKTSEGSACYRHVARFARHCCFRRGRFALAIAYVHSQEVDEMNEAPQSESPAPALTPGATQILISASRLTTAMGLTHIGAEHILLALLDDPDIAGQVLNRAGRGPSIRIPFTERARLKSSPSRCMAPKRLAP